MTAFILLAIVIWFGCGYLAMGYAFAYFQREFPGNAAKHRKSDERCAWLALLCGCCSLLGTEREYRKHGRLYPWEANP